MPEALAELRDAAAITAAYKEQMEAIEAAGSQVILMASRAFTAIAAGEELAGALWHVLSGVEARCTIH